MQPFSSPAFLLTFEEEVRKIILSSIFLFPYKGGSCHNEREDCLNLSSIINHHLTPFIKGEFPSLYVLSPPYQRGIQGGVVHALKFLYIKLYRFGITVY
ncbi:MAG: hypothetical protein AAB257_01510 [Nitrospinota bacterium]